MTNTINNVPRELLEEVMLAAQRMPVRGPSIRAKLHALLSAQSPAGVDGLEVVANFDGLYLVPLVVMAAGTELCRHSEALAAIAVRDARIAELEEKLDAARYANNFCANVADDLRAELAAIKPDYCEAIADGMEMRKELDAIKSQEPVAWMLKNEKGRIEEILPYMPCASDMQPYWPEPFQLYAAPFAKQVVIPERSNERQSDGYLTYEAQSWNACLDEVARLNAADHVDPVRAMVVPKCKCPMSISVLGDGCRYCQPQEYIDRLHDQIEEDQVAPGDSQ